MKQIRRRVSSVWSRCRSVRSIAVAVCFLFSATLKASDVWVLGGSISTCAVITWEADTLYFNHADQSATVTLLGVSDGPDLETHRQLTVPPAQVTSLALTSAWRPASLAGLYVLHLDVPASVSVEGVLNVGIDPCTISPHANARATFGVTQLPVFRALTPGGEQKTYLEVGLGGRASHTNVGIYNAGATTATASIELRHARDNALLASVVVQVPPNSTVQVPLPPQPPRGGLDLGSVQEWVTYLTVVVDQPSLSFVSTLQDGVPPGVSLVTR